MSQLIKRKIEIPNIYRSGLLKPKQVTLDFSAVGVGGHQMFTGHSLHVYTWKVFYIAMSYLQLTDL